MHKIDIANETILGEIHLEVRSHLITPELWKVTEVLYYKLIRNGSNHSNCVSISETDVQCLSLCRLGILPHIEGIREQNKLIYNNNLELNRKFRTLSNS